MDTQKHLNIVLNWYDTRSAKANTLTNKDWTIEIYEMFSPYFSDFVPHTHLTLVLRHSDFRDINVSIKVPMAVTVANASGYLISVQSAADTWMRDFYSIYHMISELSILVGVDSEKCTGILISIGLFTLNR